MSFTKQSRWIRVGWPLAALLTALPYARPAHAQIDTNPPLQNVMLLVDTSGSMEYASDGSKVSCGDVDPTLPSEPIGPSQKSRWTQLVEVLTGDVQQFSCYTQDRRSSAFQQEYKIGGVNSYDYNYHVPYHRILSGAGASRCTVGAGVVDPNPFLWGSTPFKYHVWNNPASSCSNFLQAETGLLDTYRDRMRFGLMTFDASTDAGTGLLGAGADYVSGNVGNWSYFLDWRSSPACSTNASCAKGRPAGCLTTSPMEVGARNASAPPWEGRMVPFGSPFADVNAIRANNDHIQNVLTAIRPFGATPINGMLDDARTFFRTDSDGDYTTGATCNTSTGVGCFGPRNDVLVNQGCRKNYMILLTDGEPNLDLRPYCETSDPAGSPCPYRDKSHEIVSDLARPSSGANGIKTFVIGFAVSSVDTGAPQPVDCSQISSKGSNGQSDVFDPNNLCGASMNPKLSACCNLARIAYYGGSTNAYFASNASDLRSAMSAILREIGQVTSTRTTPVFASAAGEKLGGGYSFYSSFKSDPGGLWEGVLERQRTKCVPQTSGQSTVIVPTDLPIDTASGDRFADNVNSADGNHPRLFYSVLADPDSGGNRWSERSIRPSIPVSNPDGVGVASGTLVTGGVGNFANTIPAKAMHVTQAACTDAPTSSDDACAATFLRWEIAAPNAPFATRPEAFGAIYHSTPALVGAPSEFLRDESYTTFSTQQAKRPPVLYTSTTDGQLHAFKVDVSPADPSDSFTIDKQVNNELWSFLPPAVLPKIPSQYPSTEQLLLDGAPVVKDVVFARSDADAKSGGGSAQWHTVLVSGFGAGGGGYFALDITNPVPKNGIANTGPKLLWQLTTDAAGNRLFGKRGGTPAITTLFFGQGGTTPQEYAVAILPGGDSDGPTGAQCAQQGSAALVDPAHAPRAKVPCYANDPARSLTIVRLDTGEIVRTFRASADGPASVLARARDELNAYTPLNSPVAGQPVVFPASTGAVADRAFVGDRDGALWRIDLSATDPLKWRMKLFFDAYSGQAFDAGQPIATAPVLSVDRVGNVTVAFSTGDQETFLATTGMRNYIWSLLETTPNFRSLANWSKVLLNGERVSGPMSLFSSTLYYTTFTPPSGAASQQCSNGQSRLCGVHYLLPGPGGDGGAVPVPSLNTATDPCLTFGDSIIFGAGITQKPTCNAETTYSDPYLGNTSHAGLTNVNPGKFMLVVQTGPGGKSETGGDVHTRSIELAPPMASTRIDSWAAVVE